MERYIEPGREKAWRLYYFFNEEVGKKDARN